MENRRISLLTEYFIQYFALLKEYFAVVAEIEKDRKFKNKPSKTKRQDYLKRLLKPLVELNCLHPLGENPYLRHDSTYPFIEEKIWIDKEIDINSLHYDEEKYSIDFEYSKPLNYFDPDANNIIILDEYRRYIKKQEEKTGQAYAYIEQLKQQNKRIPNSLYYPPITPIDARHTSLRKLYKEWLPTLTQKKMKSKDLLDQLLVTYTIKRALNQDKDAIDKLYSLFEKAAEAIAVKMAIARKIPEHDLPDIEQEAKIILRFLLSGYSPEYIINSLLKGDRKQYKIPLWVEKFYFWYYSEYVPKELAKINKSEPRDEHTERARRILAKRGFSKKEIDYFEIEYLLNPVAPMYAYTLWRNSPIRVMKFNSFSFRPSKGKRLSFWLFGFKGDAKKGTFSGAMKGRFCQMLSDFLDDCVKREIPYDFSDEDLDNKTPGKIKFMKEVKLKGAESSSQRKREISDEDIEKAKPILKGRGFSDRDIQIITQRLQGYSYNEIAKKHKLSRRRIIQIYKKVRLIYLTPCPSV